MSGYVGWVLAAWVVTVAVGAVVVLWPRGDAGPSAAPTTVIVQTQAAPPAPGETVHTDSSQLRKYWVDTFADAEGYPSPEGAGEPVGVLRKGDHYVFCKAWGRQMRRGDAYNHWWLLTNLDEVYASGDGPRAYVPALYLTHWGDDEAKDNAGVEIPTCPSG